MSRSISKKIRFEVFKRDSFTCQYCAAKPPQVPLEIDHIKPVSKGGNNLIDNLITSCFDCNRGKSNNELTSIPETLLQKTQKIKEAKKQYNEYVKYLNYIKELSESYVDRVEDIYNSHFNGYIFTLRFRITVKSFIDKIGIEETEISMETACMKMYDEQEVLRYFCGICWNKIKGT